MTTGIIVIISFLLSLWLTHRLSVATGRWRILDYPNARSLHAAPVPRTGGLAILMAVLTGFLLTALSMNVPPLLYWTTAATVLLAVVAWLDDVGGVHIAGRLLVQVLAALLLLLLGGGTMASLLGSGPVVGTLVFLAALLCTVWMVNLYNFMDGMDGLAGGMGVIGFACLGMLGWLAGELVFASLALVIAAAAAGFLVFNFPPARIFMGDTGSYSLGFFAAALALWGVGAGLFPVWCPVLIFSPFIVDATVTLLARAWRRERFWEAHKQHYYQRLAEAGWPHRSVVLWAYGLMLACGGSAVLASVFPDQALIAVIPVWVGLYTVLLRLIIRLERRQRSCSPP